jgi:uncharacterized membrane-anchored protein
MTGHDGAANMGSGKAKGADTDRHHGAPTFTPHPLRGAILAEMHARPFAAATTPSRLLHFAFMTDGAQGIEARAALARFCSERGAPGPAEGAKHHRVALGDVVLRWEQHSEFTTYSWTFTSGQGGEQAFAPAAGALAGVMSGLPQPGLHLVSVDLHILDDATAPAPERLFEEASLATSIVDGGAALVATDFRAGADGFVRIMVSDRGLTPPRAGALVQRLLEIETYRTLALLGLPEAHRLSPVIKTIEDSLVRIAGAMPSADDLVTEHALLDELTTLAASLEADTTSASYRFGASRAYDGIVQQRLAAIGEMPVEGWPTIAAFLARRMAPAMRTCQMLQDRQADLSRKLTRAANLLRTRVNVAVEQQNRDVLSAMNERTRLQLRLQQTVEGLSVAAIGYYVVSLFGYLAKGAKDAGFSKVDPGVATAIFVPFAVAAIWWAVRRIRRGTEG